MQCSETAQDPLTSAVPPLVTMATRRRNQLQHGSQEINDTLHDQLSPDGPGGHARRLAAHRDVARRPPSTCDRGDLASRDPLHTTFEQRRHLLTCTVTEGFGRGPRPPHRSQGEAKPGDGHGADSRSAGKFLKSVSFQPGGAGDVRGWSRTPVTRPTTERREQGEIDSPRGRCSLPLQCTDHRPFDLPREATSRCPAWAARSRRATPSSSRAFTRRSSTSSSSSSSWGSSALSASTSSAPSSTGG